MPLPNASAFLCALCVWSSALSLRQQTPVTADSEAFRISRISFTRTELDDIRPSRPRARHYQCGNAGSSPTALTRAGAVGEEPVICVRRKALDGRLAQITALVRPGPVRAATGSGVAPDRPAGDRRMDPRREGGKTAKVHIIGLDF